MRAGGAPLHVIEKAKPKDFEIWPENVEALEVFLQLETQWRIIAGMGGAVYQGLDYSALAAVVQLRGCKRKKRLFENVRLIEIGALKHVNKKAQQ